MFGICDDALIIHFYVNILQMFIDFWVKLLERCLNKQVRKLWMG